MDYSTYGHIDSEHLVYSQKFPSFHADVGFQLLDSTLSAPRFLQTSVADRRAAWVRTLGDQDHNVGALATLAYWRARGLLHLSPQPTRRSMGKVSLGTVEDYSERVIYPENAILSVVSSLPTAKVRRMLEEHLRRWGWGQRAAIDLDALSDKGPVKAVGRLVVVPVVGSAQSAVQLHFDAPGWQDWRANRMAWGVAKLLEKKAKRLREALGITYGVHADMTSLKQHGVLELTGNVERKATDVAVRQLVEAVQKLRTQKVTEGELEFVKRSLMQDQVQASDSALAKAHTIALRAFRGLSPEHDAEAVSYIASWTVEDLQRAVENILGAPWLLVVAGQEPQGATFKAVAPNEVVVRYQAHDLL